MQAQDGLNEEPVGDGQADGVLADLNANNIENRAPIKHVDSYMRDNMHDKIAFWWYTFGRNFSSHGKA